jgi:hypothetical protein
MYSKREVASKQASSILFFQLDILFIKNRKISNNRKIYSFSPVCNDYEEQQSN